jgi:hypothetical protein
MEEEKRKRKRRKSKKKKSKSQFVETVSKNIISTNDEACLADIEVPYKKAKVIGIKKDHEGSTYLQIKDLKHKRNRIKKIKKRMKTEKSINSPNFNDINGLYHNKLSTDVIQPTTSNLNKAKSDVKLEKDSVASIQTLPNKRSNTPNQKLSLKEKLQNKLESGRFRWINEKLYTTNSSSAFKMFESEPELFDVYHQGFSSQVQKWPVNPVDTMIDWIMQR